MLRVYVAGQYSADNVIGVLRNMQRGMKAAEQIFSMGYAPFCPWHDYHYELLADHPKGLYYAYSMAWLEVSDIVVLLEGWENSPGTIAEKKRAEELGIPVMLFADFLGAHERGELSDARSLDRRTVR